MCSFRSTSLLLRSPHGVTVTVDQGLILVPKGVFRLGCFALIQQLK